jgi:ubiquinone/menaquinone biosynthesis C-methylase UbiE
MPVSPHRVTAEAILADYNRIAADYDTRWAGFLAAVADGVQALLPADLAAQPRVLELGCGTGAFLRLVQEYRPEARLTGVDLCPAMLARARTKLPTAQLQEADLERVSFPEASFDLMLSLNVLHHLNDLEAHLRQLAHWCHPEGTILLCDFSRDSFLLRLAEFYWERFHPSHHRAYSHRELTRRIREHGGLTVRAEKILRPDRFWRLQLYQLSSAGGAGSGAGTATGR